MSKRLKYTYYDPSDREQWLKLRREFSGVDNPDKVGFGGSDIGTILGYNQYEFKGELFYRKLGLLSDKIEDTEPMFWGRETEPIIAENWQYWDGTNQGYLENKAAGKKINECKELHAIVTNTKYPYLFANIDREFYRLVNVRRRHSILECKNISRYVQDQYESKIPTSHILQIQDYLMIFGDSYGELAYLVDGQKMEAFPVKSNKRIQRKIQSETDAFAELILEGKRIIAETPDPNERDYLLSQIEPEADNTAACDVFLSKRAKDKLERNETDASMEDILHGERILSYDKILQRSKNNKRLYQNKIKQSMLRTNSRKLLVGTDGSITLGRNNTLYIKMKS